MTNLSKTIIFFGTDDFSQTSLESLIAADYKIAAVVTKPDSKSGRGQTLTMPCVKRIALNHNIPVWQPTKVSETEEKIKLLNTDVTGVLVSFGKIIPQSTIDLFNPGIVNVHPSLLPKYRGPSPIETAIKNGDNQIGVSIMQLTASVDAGPIYSQITYPLNGTETGPELYESLSSKGAEMLIELLPAIMNGSLNPIPQDDNSAVYCKLISKTDAWPTPDTLTAEQFERIVRAHLSFPKTKIKIFDHEIIITKAHVESEQKTVLDILCSDKKYLSIDELIAPSGRKISGKDFLNGYKF